MPLNRFSSRRHRLYDAFLGDRLKGAVSYDRIAGYFQSSLLGLAAQEFSAIKQVRIVCNTEVTCTTVWRTWRHRPAMNWALVWMSVVCQNASAAKAHEP